MEDGGTPWCVGFESGGATGWPATDWMEDIVLDTAGPEVYDQWVNHEIPFNDPAIVHAGELFGDVMFTDGYVLGGADQTPAIAFGDAPGPMFEDPPGCWLHRQANFINAFFPEDAEAGVDYDWFPFPAIDEQITLFGGEFSAIFRDAPEVRDFLERFAGEEVQCAQGGERASSRISPNVNVGTDCYVDSVLADASEVLTDRVGRRVGAVRRLGPDAVCGGGRQLLDRHGRVPAGRPRRARASARGHRGELAVLVAMRETGLRPSTRRGGAVAVRPLPQAP